MSDFPEEFKRLVLWEAQATQYIRQLEDSIENLTARVEQNQVDIDTTERALSNEVERREHLQEQLDLEKIRTQKLTADLVTADNEVARLESLLKAKDE